MLVKELQPENALSPILVTLFEIVMFVKELQPSNALSPILVTLSGITILSNELQPENAELPILVPPVIVTSFKLEGTYIELFS